jgi:hypothetical protein
MIDQIIILKGDLGITILVVVCLVAWVIAFGFIIYESFFKENK